MPSPTDRIEKKVVLRASRERVWRAISESREFGSWFGVDFDGPFVAGQPLKGRIVPTRADPEIAKSQQPYAGTPFEISVTQLEPLRCMAFRWHPYAVDEGQDYSKEPTTLVTFELEDAAEGGTQLTITESGFDSVPLERRAKAFSQNEQGWTIQTSLISKYLAAHA
ncbi:MAG TPA: SRPBCC family protein [Polyangiaceae bacterium]|nr:SRPBCC family protein [Polyangiaceae bacterium]